MAAEELSVKWYVAKTRHGQEIGVRNRLASLGIENFIPTQTRKASRGKGNVERVLIPGRQRTKPAIWRTTGASL